MSDILFHIKTQTKIYKNDQGGKYTQNLNITHVPVIVKQDGTQLKITEISNTEI